MPDDFKAVLNRFTDAGNTLVGEPWRVIGATRLVWRGTGHTLQFGEGVDIRDFNVNFDSRKNEPGHLCIGDRVTVRISASIGDGCSISIGPGCAFNKKTSISAWENSNVTIGHNCLFSDATIRTSDMHSIFDIGSGDRINQAKDVVIEDRVWLADRTIVLKGAVIGSGSVLGAGAIASGSIPQNSLAVGTPAKVIRQGITWSRELVDRIPTA